MSLHDLHKACKGNDIYNKAVFDEKIEIKLNKPHIP